MSQAQDDFEYLVTETGLENRGYNEQIASIRQALTEPAVPEAVRELPEKWRNKHRKTAALAYAENRCADELERALAQQGDDSGEGDD